MSAIPPTIEPASFVTGETVVWSKSFTDYPASEWALTYYFRGGSTGINVAAAADGDDFLVTITAAANTLAAGVWDYQAFLTKGSEKYLAASGKVTVKASLTGNEATTFDGRSQAKKILEALDAMIEGTASVNQKRYQINNRELERYSLTELIALRTHYANLVAREQQAERLKDGKGFLKNIHTRFTRPQ